MELCSDIPAAVTTVRSAGKHAKDKEKDKREEKDKHAKGQRAKPEKTATPPVTRKALEAALRVMHRHMYTNHAKTACEQFKAMLSHPNVKHSVNDLRALTQKQQTIVSAITDLAGVIGYDSMDAPTRAYLDHLDSQILEHNRMLRSSVANVFRLHQLSPHDPLVLFEPCAKSEQIWTSAIVLPSVSDIVAFAYKRDDVAWYNRLEDALVKALVSALAYNAYPQIVLGYSVVGCHACLLVEKGVVLQQKDPEFLDLLHSLVLRGIDQKLLKDIRDCVTPNRFCHNFTRFELPPLITSIQALKCIANGPLTVSENLMRHMLAALMGRLKVVIVGEVTTENNNIHILLPEFFKLLDKGWTDHVVGTLEKHEYGQRCEDLDSMLHFKASGLIVCINSTPPMYVRYIPKNRTVRYFEGDIPMEKYIIDAVYRLIKASKGREPFSTHSFGGLATSQCTVAEGIFIDHAVSPTYTSIPEWTDDQ